MAQALTAVSCVLIHLGRGHYLLAASTNNHHIKSHTSYLIHLVRAYTLSNPIFNFGSGAGLHTCFVAYSTAQLLSPSTPSTLHLHSVCSGPRVPTTGPGSAGCVSRSSVPPPGVERSSSYGLRGCVSRSATQPQESSDSSSYCTFSAPPWPAEANQPTWTNSLYVVPYTL